MSEWHEGWHRGKAIDFAISQSDSGTTAIAVLLQVAAGDPSGDELRIITWYGYCTDAAIDNTVQSLRVLGWQGTDLSEFESSEIRKVEDLLPNDVSFPINLEEYQGKINAKVGKICRASAGKVAVKNRLEGNEAKAFAARFKAACAAQPATAQRAAAPAPRKPASSQPTTRTTAPDGPPLFTGGDDEFPF